jgi:phosphoribosylglycinamide formyltransferase-1
MELKLGFFASGSGSNIQAILDNIRKGLLRAEAKVIITNNSDAGIVERAKRAGVPCYHVSSATHPEENERAGKFIEILKKHDVNLICLAGYMKKLPDKVMKEFKGKVLNIHPALLPKFGGKGMYGMNVHRAVIESGDKITGATVHIVSSEYDKGRILSQTTVPVMPGEKAEELQKRVLKAEHIIYSETLQKIADGEIIL